jgi:hypothetical protein
LHAGPLFRKKLPLIPDPGQRVRLRAGHRLLGGSFRAISEPATAETGEVVIWVAREQEYEDSIREGRPAVGRPWPAKQMEVVLSPLEEANEAQHKLPQASESARQGQGTKERLLTQEVTQEGSEGPWLRKVFGGAASAKVVEVTSAEPEPVGIPLEEFERYTRTKPPGA